MEVSSDWFESACNACWPQLLLPSLDLLSDPVAVHFFRQDTQLRLMA